MNAKYWIGPVGALDDFGVLITDEFIDGKVMDTPGSP
jgi:hypothetical protein